TVNTESLITNPMIQGFFDAMDQVMQPIGGKYLDFYQGNTLAWAGGNIQGKELYRILCENPTIRQMLKNPVLPVDMEYIFSSVEGDFAIGWTKLTSNDFLMYADVKHADFLQTFEDLRPLLALTGGQITLDNVGPNEYLMRTYYGHFWFGVKNNRLYVTNNRTWAEEVGRTYGASLGVKPWSAEVKQNRLYASLNLASMANELSLFRSLPMLGGQQNTMIVKLFAGQCDYLNFSMPDGRHGKAELVLKDKNVNLLGVLVDVLGGL
ncbi:MAG: DUF4836 family protein, partial [Bacteroidaceae bacterium]|nr:DUF4836 family protein [Bacteroidaceae bacterium]